MDRCSLTKRGRDARLQPLGADLPTPASRVSGCRHRLCLAQL